MKGKAGYPGQWYRVFSALPSNNVANVINDKGSCGGLVLLIILEHETIVRVVFENEYLLSYWPKLLIAEF